MKNSLNRSNSVLHAKSYAFALRIIGMVQFIRKQKHERTIGEQVLRSGTAIGALVREAEFAQSNADFINKLSIALKEANETDYWLNLLKDSGYLDEKAFASMEKVCGELMALLIASIKTVKNKREKEENRH